ncbi:hypothetical protein LJC68_04420 [Bacteroidales bacterium OttesenSCG-928-B11]|nr:hypothetical protein [Bacteroidales bacterium OttesenSCG-928-C03]MDL2312103.1 hypothetical protein [Bacteroidales bacterium OttesenSCG-928-B11]MDL2326076.1 hypothetical protein [Bacteroidales bacterium OttesenSCG-928-A14]
MVAETISVNAQSKFEVKDFGSFKIHSYATADPLGDMSYIIEGKNALVILEPVLFHVNIKEFGEYVESLKKPIEKVIASYHTGGFNAFDPESIVMIEGMPEFEKGEAYSGMSAYLAELEHAKKSGASLFIGGHGMGTAEMKDVDFQIAYLKKMKELMNKEKSSEGFIAAMKKAYP